MGKSLNIKKQTNSNLKHLESHHFLYQYLVFRLHIFLFFNIIKFLSARKHFLLFLVLLKYFYDRLSYDLLMLLSDFIINSFNNFISKITF